MRRSVSVGWIAVVLIELIACAGYETEHFKGRVNEATEVMVAKRYGLPHKVVQIEDGREVWTYFDRGSGTSSYAGTARSTFCVAYLLTFDRQGILRVWQQQECEN